MIISSIPIFYLKQQKPDKMKYQVLAIYVLFLLPWDIQGQGFDENQIAQITGQLDDQLNIDYPNFEDASDTEKRNQFTAMLNSVAGAVFAKQWEHPTNENWSLVDWSKVDTLDNFFSNQTEVLENVGVVADTNDEAARFGLAYSLVSAGSSSGADWFQVWLMNQAQANDSNLKWLVYFSADDLGIDNFKFDTDGKREVLTVDWNAWKQAYDNSNKLGKAILLKCMTRMALITKQWDRLKEIHLSVFNGADDELKAIALIKGDNGLGDTVMAKWSDIANNSTNAKLKSLAQQIIARQSPDEE